MEPIKCKFTRVLVWSMVITIFLFLVGCTIDEIESVPLPEPSVQMVFDTTESIVLNNQEITFTLLTEEYYTLIISDLQTESIITKETFKGIVGDNTKKIYTNILPKEKLELRLVLGNDILQKTTIIPN